MVTRKGLDQGKDDTQTSVMKGLAETFTGKEVLMASSKVEILNELNFDTLVLRANRTVLVDFSAEWCGPCKVQSKILDRIAEESDAVLVGAVDVDACPELAAR